MRTAILAILACVSAAPVLAQTVVCDPLCRDPSASSPYGGAAQNAPFQTSKASAASSAKASSSSSSRSQSVGSIAGTQVNAPISSTSKGGSASVTVINQTSASNRSGSGSRGSGSGGGWQRNATSTASTASDPPADPGPALGSPQLPLTENLNGTGTTTVRNVPEIVPAPIGGSNPCLVGLAAGGAGPGIGVTLSWGHADAGCERRNESAVLFNEGQKDAAVELLCDDEHVRAAMLRSGHPCAADRPVRPVATAPTPQVARAVDPAIIRREQQIMPLQEIAATPPARPRAPRPEWCWSGDMPKGVSFAQFNAICGQ